MTDPAFSVPLIRARFVERPNRFVILAEDDSGRRICAHLPNPGRLWELLLPGAVLYIAPSSGGAAAAGAVGGGGGGKATVGPPRKTDFTCVAVERDGAPVFLHTHQTNAVAARLIARQGIPGLEAAELARAEVKVGASRFDFLLRENGRDVLMEVKSVTLFANGVAMFPDAVTDRGRRHLLELAELSEATGVQPVVLFLVHSPQVQWFLPDYHTDLAFGRALLAVRHRLRLVPVALEWDADLRPGDRARLLEIPWDFLEREMDDRGAYVVVCRLKEGRSLAVGALGEHVFPAGYYLYVGSAMANLDRRVARHLRRKKPLRWHIDFLTTQADERWALPIRASRREECEVARTLAALFAPGPAPGFGSSDCRCETHLFYSADHPLRMARFYDVLHHFRMRPPDGGEGAGPERE